jgi:hypothetical protein
MNYKKLSNKTYKIDTGYEEIIIEYDGPESNLKSYLYSEILSKGKDMVYFNQESLNARFNNPPSNDEVEI